MAIFIKYQYQIAGENDIKRSMSSVADHAERQNQRILRSQATTRRTSVQAANTNASAKEAEAYFRAQEAAAKKAANAQIREEQRAARAAVKEHEKAEREQTRITERESRARAREEERWATKNRQLKEQHFKSLAQRERDEERITQRHRASVINTTRGVIGGTARTVANVGRGALAVTGIGGTFLAANALHEGAKAERSATGLANQMAGEGASVADIKRTRDALLKKAADVHGFSSTEALDAARTFGGISGNYAMGMDLTKELSQISLATDVDMQDVARLAGNAYMKLKTPEMSEAEAGKQALSAVRLFAGQGNIGAVEIKDLAQYGGRLTASAAKFQGSRLQNMAQMGTLAQVAVGSGSATDAAEATEAAMRFASDLTEHMDRVGQIQLNGKGINPFTDSSKTQFRGIKDLIADIVEGTGGSIPKMHEIFGARSEKMTEAFARKYYEAETANAALAPGERKAKGKAGRAAIEAEFEKFNKAALTENDQRLRAEAALTSVSMQTEEAMKKMNLAISTELLPIMPGLIKQFAELAPMVGKTAKLFASLIGWLTENPLKGLGTLIAAAFIKELAFAKIGNIIAARVNGASAGAAVTGTGAGAAGMVAGGAMAGGFMRNANGSVLRNTTMGGAFTAGMTGLAIGGAVYSAIDYGGKSEFDETSRKSGDITKGLSRLHGDELGSALVDASEQVRRLKEDQGMLNKFLDLFGAGSGVEIRSAEEMLQRKTTEYQEYTRTGKLSPEAQADIEAQRMQIDAATKLSQAADNLVMASANMGTSSAFPNRGNAPTVK